MDALMVLAGRLAPSVFATEKMDVNLMGRWVGGLGRGLRPGCRGLRSEDARRLVSIMLVGHAAFGAGIARGTAYQTQGMKRLGT
jgi:hypothetical protein